MAFITSINKIPIIIIPAVKISDTYAELNFLCIVLKTLGRYESLDIATNILLIPGTRASKTDPVAIVEQIVIRKEKSENLLTSKATLSGVREFSIISGLILSLIHI